MAKESTSSQSQQKDKTASIPGASWTDGVARLEALVEQMAAWEKQAIARATEAAEHSAELAKTGLGYIAKLNEAWRKMTIDAARQGAQVFSQQS